MIQLVGSDLTPPIVSAGDPYPKIKSWSVMDSEVSILAKNTKTLKQLKFPNLI